MGNWATAWVSGGLVIFASACAARTSAPAESPAPAAEPAPAAAAPVAAEASSSRTADQPDRSDERPEAESVPTSCAPEGGAKPSKVCLVGATYAQKLCAGVYPEMALSFFAKGTPWTRAYLAADVEAWNASGGHTHAARLAFDEEVIVLAKHGAPSAGGIVMTGSQASYDVLRWDGSCVSISEGEMTMRRPPAPKTAVVLWKRLDVNARRALLASGRVKASSDALDKACSSSDDKACEKGSRALSLAIAEHVRSGGSLPPPPRRP